MMLLWKYAIKGSMSWKPGHYWLRRLIQAPNKQSLWIFLLLGGRSPQKGTVTSGGCQKKEHHFADYLMHFEMIYSHFWQNQTTLGLSDVQNKFAPLSFYVCHTNILGFEAFLSSEIWFGLSCSITIAAFCMPNILVYQDQESVHK